jgi:hypothetical protein
LLYSNHSFGIVGLQTNDTLFVRDNDFAEVEYLKLQEANFLAKERERLITDYNLKFNGGIIRTDSTGITLTQERQYGNLYPVTVKNTTMTSSRGIIYRNLIIKE